MAYYCLKFVRLYTKSFGTKMDSNACLNAGCRYSCHSANKVNTPTNCSNSGNFADEAVWTMA